MKSNRFISDHPEFGAFLKKELEQLGIRREAFRSTCHMKQNYLEDIKKGLHNYEVDSYEIILSAFKEFTTPENAQRIYREGVKTLFPKLKE